MKSITTLALLAFAAACSDSTSTTPAAVPATIAIDGGNGQTIRVTNTALTPLTVLVRDAHGQPVTAAIVTFTTDGTGSFDSRSVYTDSTGIASVMYTAGTKSGTDSVYAAVEGVATPVLFTFTTKPSDPIQLQDVGPAQETGAEGTPLPTPFTVKLVDIFGNPIAGATVTWTTTDGILSATTSTTDEDGMASVTLTLGATPGNETVTAHADNVADVTFTAVAVAGT